VEPVKAIFFDLDDTLLWDERSIQLAFEDTCELAKRKYELDPKVLEENTRKAARELYESYDVYPFTQMIGINPFEGLWGEFRDEGKGFQQLKEIAPEYRKKAWTEGLKAMGVNDPEFGEELGETFPAMRKKHPLLYEDSLPVLQKLKGKFKLILITNGSPDLQKTKLTLTPELAPLFDEIIISGDVGRGKPDPVIFEHALKLASVKAEEAMMVGDNLNTDILGANRTGIPSAWLNRKGKKANPDIRPTYEITKLEHLLELL